jgi:uncharacterized membrane protein
MWSTALHVLFVFIAFSLSSGVGILAQMVAQSGDVRSIRNAARAARPLHTIGGVMLLLGIIFGFATAATQGFPLNSQWLVITYVLVAILIILIAAFIAPLSAQIERAAAASPDDKPSPELVAVLNSPKRFAAPLAGLVWVAIILVMVLKP